MLPAGGRCLVRLFISFPIHVVKMEIRWSGELRSLTRVGRGGRHVKVVMVGGHVGDARRERSLGLMILSAGRRTWVTAFTSSLSKHKKVFPPRSRGHFHPSVRVWRPDTVEGGGR